MQRQHTATLDAAPTAPASDATDVKLRAAIEEIANNFTAYADALESGDVNATDWLSLTENTIEKGVALARQTQLKLEEAGKVGEAPAEADRSAADGGGDGERDG